MAAVLLAGALDELTALELKTADQILGDEWVRWAGPAIISRIQQRSGFIIKRFENTRNLKRGAGIIIGFHKS